LFILVFVDTNINQQLKRGEMTRKGVNASNFYLVKLCKSKIQVELV
jgi:hypothetical protein